MGIFKKKTPEQRQEGTTQIQKLLSARKRKYIGKSFTLGQLICCHPFEWNSKEKRPEFTTSTLRLLAWFFNVAFCTAYFAFVVVQCIRTNASDDAEQSTKVLMFFVAILFSLPVLLHSTYVMTWNETAVFVSSYFSYCDMFECKFIQADAKPSKNAKMSDLFTTYTYFAFTTDAVLIFGLFGLSRLDSPEQLSSLLHGNPIMQILVCILFCFYYGISSASNGLIFVTTTFAAMFAFYDVLAELGKDTSDVTNQVFGRPKERVQTYRALLLYVEAINRIFWFVLVTSKYVIMFVSVMCTYGAIRLGGVLGLTLAVFGFSLTMNLMAFLNGWAEFALGCTKALDALVTLTTAPRVIENKPTCAWLRRSIRSLPVARLPIAGAYFVNKDLVLNVINIIIDNVVFLLVNY